MFFTEKLSIESFFANMFIMIFLCGFWIYLFAGLGWMLVV
jgi:hypothetical protein